MAVVSRALFKDAYLQREVIVDVDVCPLCYVGDLVTYDPATKTIAAATAATAANAAIIAQSDITMHNIVGNATSRSNPGAHVDIESKTWQSDKSVAAKATGGVNKKVAIFRVTNPLDVVIYQGDATTEQLA
jgi:hypothetical protein